MVEQQSTLQHWHNGLNTRQVDTDRSVRGRSSRGFLQSRLHRLSISSARSLSDDHVRHVGEGKGPLGLTLLHEPSEPRIDFIFIHGLNGGSRKTWSHTPDPSMFWPKVWLPNETGFKHVRIHSFGYNADWNTRKDSRLTVHDFGQALIADMFNSPSLKKNGNTPIVFVSHSMGGLVAKKAYLLATRNPIYKSIAERIHTMFFLATPHRGADSAQFARLLRHSATYGTKAFIDDLLPGSGTLDQLNDEFRHVCDRLNLWSFLESVPTTLSFMTTLIVNKSSAVLGLPKEHIQYLEATHRDICKFDTPTNSNYLVLQRAFATTIENMEANISFQNRDEYRLQMKQIASYLRIDQRPDANWLATHQKQQSGSCEWLTESREFQEWLSTPSDDWESYGEAGLLSQEAAGDWPNILWLNGRPGTGKSVAASHAIEYLQSCNLDCSFYFFKHEDKSTISVSTLLRSIAFQIAESNFEVRRILASMAEDDIRINHDDHHILWASLFVANILKIEQTRPQYWVVDAVDECSSKSLPALVSILSALCVKSTIRILLTSLPGGQLERLLSQENVTYSEIQTGRDGSLKDIELFLKSRCSPTGTPEAFEKFVKDILTKSNGNFLWASLTVAKLEDAYSLEDKRAVLEQIPQEMDEFYTRIITSLTESTSFEITKRILTWVICSSRPLSSQELDEAIRVDINRTLTASGTQLESLTGHLIFVDSESRIHMTHQTMVAFLTRKRDGFWVDRAQGHTRIAELCLEILCGTSFTPPRARRGGKVARNTARSSLADFAALEFSYHLAYASAASDTLHALLSRFLRSNVMSWIERMAETNNLWALQVAATRFKTYLARRAKYQSPMNVETQTISAWVTDLHHIAAAFHSNLALSPSSAHWLLPHLCPPSSMARQLFANATRGPRVVGGFDKEWSDRLTCYLYSEEATTVACSNKLLAVGLASGDIRIYHLVGSMNFLNAGVANHSKKVRQLAFNKTSSLLASCSARKLTLWEINGSQTLSLTIRWTINIGFTPFSLAFNTDESSILLTNPQQSSIAFFKVSDGSVESPLLLHTSADSDSSDADGQSVFWTPSDRIRIDKNQTLAVVAYRNASVTVWDLEAEECIGTFEKEGFENTHSSPQTLDMLFNPVAEVELLAVTYKDGDVVTCNPWTLEQDKIYHLHVSLSGLAATGDGRILAGSGDDGGIYLFLFETLQPIYQIGRLDGMLRINHITFSMDDLRLFDTRGQSCSVWEPFVLVPKSGSDDASSEPFSEELVLPEPSGTQAHEFPWGEAVTFIEPASDLGCVLAGRQDGSVDVCNTKTGDVLEKLQLHEKFAEIKHMEWNESKGILLTLDSLSRLIVTTVTNLGKPSEIQHTCLTDLRESDFLHQAFFIADAEAMVICTSTELRVMQMDTTVLATISVVAGDHWTRHPTDSSLLVRVRYDSIGFYESKSLREISSSQLSHVLPMPTPGNKHVWMQNTGSNYLARSVAGPASSAELTVLDISKLASASPEVLQQVIRGSWFEIQSVLGCLKSTLFFLNSAGWVCSVGLKNLENATHYSRHFFIPLTWRTGSDCIIRILSKSAVALGRGEQLVIFHGFLEFEESVPFRV